MSKKVAPIPKGYRTITPCLVVPAVDTAMEFFTQAFEAVILSEVKDPTDTLTVHATLKIGNSLVMLQRESAEHGIHSPATLGYSSGQVHLYVEAVDTIWANAIEAGAVSISDPVDTYWGDRSGILIDPFGHRWSLASRVEHVSAAESSKRAAELYASTLPLESEALDVVDSVNVLEVIAA